MQDRKIDQMGTVAKNREDTYGFLAGIFREELSAKQLEGLVGGDLLKRMIEAGCRLDPDYFQTKSIEQIEEELACEYAALFIGPGEHVAPYESIYVPDSTGRVGYYWGECTVDMRNWVEHYGLAVSEKFKSIPDHVSVVLEFMQRVVEQERLAWERDDRQTAERAMEVERTFFNKHISGWVPTFCDRVTEAANLDFYREVARLTRDFVLKEGRLLNAAAGN